MVEYALTDLEKILIEYIALTGKKIWYDCYIYSHVSKSTNKQTLANLASKWKHSDIVTSYYNSCITEIAQRKERDIQTEVKKRGVMFEGGTNSPEVTKMLHTDFTDRSQFLDYLNKQVNTITDDKTRTDYLKMLSDLLRFKETGIAKDSDIMRFYSPLTCYSCPLYQDQSK